MTLLRLLVNIKYSILSIYCSWFVFVLFLHGLYLYSSSIWRILGQFKPSEKAQSRKVPGVPPPRPLPGSALNLLGGLQRSQTPNYLGSDFVCSTQLPPYKAKRNDSENSSSLPLHSKCPVSATAQVWFWRKIEKTC